VRAVGRGDHADLQALADDVVVRELLIADVRTPLPSGRPRVVAALRGSFELSFRDAPG
jgi:hypothetical protein